MNRFVSNASMLALVFIMGLSPKGFAQLKGFTGYASGVVTTDQVIKLETGGWADKASQKAYSRETIQNIGSVSKTFIGIALLQAQEQGLLSLDEDINTYLDFTVANPHINTAQEITLRHLATHTAGITDRSGAYKKAYSKGKEPAMAMGEYLRAYFDPRGDYYSQDNFIEQATGTHYQYSNIGATLAAYIVERVAGVSFADYTRQHILQPLGMNQSGWSYGAIDESKHAMLYGPKGKVLKTYTLVTYPDGGMRTSPEDLALYLQELLRGYQHQSDLLSAASWDALFEPQFGELLQVANKVGDARNSGIFFGYAKSGMIGHTGSDPGASAIIYFDPDKGRGYFMMANTDIGKQNVEDFKAFWAELVQTE